MRSLLLVFICSLVACAGTPRFDAVADRDWLLTEVRSGSGSMIIDREQLAAVGFEGAFTLRFDAERLSGMGAPNRYFAPYTLVDRQAGHAGQGITIMPIAGTLMAALFEPPGLQEQTYFTLLQQVTRWNLVRGNLELYSGETVLVFAAME